MEDPAVRQARRGRAVRGADRPRAATGLRGRVRDRGARAATSGSDRLARRVRAREARRDLAHARLRGSGGIFSPSLFMGAALGRGVGDCFHWLFPSVTAPSGGYALVGMAAVFGGVAQAPITSILILFEMT